MNLLVGININWFAGLHGTAFQNYSRFLFLAPQASDVGSIPIAPLHNSTMIQLALHG
jgi:hypothetical protein